MSVFYSKKNKRWYVQITQNKKRYTISKNFNNKPFLTKRDALKYSYGMNQTQIPTTKTTIIKTEIGFKNWLNRNYKITTAYSIISFYNNYLKGEYAYLSLSNINDAFLLTFATKISFNKHLSYVTKCHKLVYFKSYLNCLKEEYGLTFNDSLIKINKNVIVNRSSEFNYYSSDEFNLFISKIPKNNIKDLLIFYLLFYYGLRIGELRGIVVSDINLNDNTLSINRSFTNKYGKPIAHLNETQGQYINTKTISSRRVYPLTNSIKDLIIKAINQGGLKSNDPLIPAKSNKFIVVGETYLRKQNKKYAELAKLKHIRIHDFRHSCAINLFKNGFDVVSISKWLGHSSPAATYKYYLTYTQKDKDTIAKFLDKS